MDLWLDLVCLHPPHPPPPQGPGRGDHIPAGAAAGHCSEFFLSLGWCGQWGDLGLIGSCTRHRDPVAQWCLLVLPHRLNPP